MEGAPAMANMLDLPRELYLDICAALTTKELTALAGVSRDHYLAVQYPLFSHIRISCFGALVRLVGTLTRAPIVSRISPKQRQFWHKLSDAELRERNINRLDLTIDNEKDGSHVTGAVLSRCIGAISRKCETVKISLTLLALSEKLVKELNSVTVPNVVKLVLFVGPSHSLYGGSPPDNLQTSSWTFVFSGLTFPDLRAVYFNSLVDRFENMPSSMENGFQMAARARRRRGGITDSPTVSEDGYFHGLTGMQEITIEYNNLLDGDILKSLFGSQTIPKRLTKLEIVNCPSLHPIKDLKALATLLERALQLVQILKLHLTWHFDGHPGYETAYTSKISEKPERHLCNIVREVGQKIKGLDLAIPFACSRMFVPTKGAKQSYQRTLELPDVPPEPVHTLPQRLMTAGYRYRRLIFNAPCPQEHGWDEMAALACNQGEKISWELLHDGDECQKACWFVSGCAPVEFGVMDAMQRPFNET